jgi:hypothetical protein
MTARRRLANRRLAESFDVEAQGLKFTGTIGRFADGTLAEVFLSALKAGSAADTSAKDAAVVCSLGLQHGVPLATIRHALLRDAQGVASSPLGVALDRIAEEKEP